MRKIQGREKQGALELSIGTIVVLVLGMSMLILGLVLIRTIFSGAKYNVEIINKNVEAEINKLFEEGGARNVVVYLPNAEAEVKKGNSFGVAFGIRNTARGEAQASTFTYTVKATSVQEGCTGLDTTIAEKYLILGRTGSVNLLPGSEPYFNTVKFQASDSAPLCEIRYELEVLKGNQPYGNAPFTVIIK